MHQRHYKKAGCGSMMFKSFGLTYSQVCGYVRGYSFGTVDAFVVGRFNQPLSGNYVDGVSISYGNPPDQHVWTCAAGQQENGSHPSNCPCNTLPGIGPPSYIGSSYYCESGSPSDSSFKLFTWYTSDPLWDGMQCGGDEGPCCNHTGLPWFNKNTPTPTTATINVRICLGQKGNDENIGIECLELFVK